jgi:PST family polysaccharide transporter
MLFLITPFLQNYYSLTDEGKFLLYALGISLLLSSLKTIPSVLMERELDFSRLILPQVAENLAYNLTAVFLAWKGFGVRSFTYAVVVRGLVGLITIYLLKPWIPGTKFSKESLKKLLHFGVPYQANTFIATLKDDGMTAFLGGILGPSGISFGLGAKMGTIPIKTIYGSLLVTFPAFSRMRDEKTHRLSVTRSIFSFAGLSTMIGL